MKFRTRQAGDHSLRADESVALPDARVVTVPCASRDLWVTLDGDRRDLVIESGERLEVASNAVVGVNAIRPSRLTVRIHPARKPRTASYGEFASRS